MQLSTNNLPAGTPMTEKLPMFNPLELMLRRKSMENEEHLLLNTIKKI